MQSGLSALHLAAQEDKVAVAEILARNGANLDQQTKVGNVTLLQYERHLSSSVIFIALWRMITGFLLFYSWDTHL